MVEPDQFVGSAIPQKAEQQFRSFGAQIPCDGSGRINVRIVGGGRRLAVGELRIFGLKCRRCGQNNLTRLSNSAPQEKSPKL